LKISQFQVWAKYWFDFAFLHSPGNPLLREMALYHWPPCSNKLRSAAFSMENFIYLFFTKQATIMRWPTVLSLPPSISFSCLVSSSQPGFHFVWLLIPLSFDKIIKLKGKKRFNKGIQFFRGRYHKHCTAVFFKVCQGSML